MMQRRVFVSGVVQGVGFRASTLRVASRFPDLKGFVRNLSDGRVEAVFSGEDTSVLEMVAWCKRGPSSARVSSLEVKEETVDSSLPEFSVKGAV
jgi:acylphosphatase